MATKYRPGRRIKTMKRLLTLYLKREPIYWRGKYFHYGFYQNWTLKMLENSIDAGNIRYVRKRRRDD